jgi:phage tail protein X
MKYRTKDGDVLDAVCDAHYQDVAYDLHAVLEANPGLAAIGPVLPSGRIIELPVFETNPVQSQIRLWD